MAAAPPPKADELQPHPPKEQLAGVSFCITSPPPWRTCFSSARPPTLFGKSFVSFRCSNVLRACPLALFFSALLLFSDAEAFTFGSVAMSLLILYSCKVLGIITELNLFLLICLCWCLLQTDVSVIKSVHHFPVPS